MSERVRRYSDARSQIRTSGKRMSVKNGVMRVLWNDNAVFASPVSPGRLPKSHNEVSLLLGDRLDSSRVLRASISMSRIYYLMSIVREAPSPQRSPLPPKRF